MSYDPDPRRRRRRTHDPARRGRVPPQLRAGVFGRRRKRYDPGKADHKRYGVGKRGGVYWGGGRRKKRYDPERFARVRRYGRRIGGKFENFINRFGTLLGGLGAFGIGFKGAYDALQNVTYPDQVGNKNWMERYLWLIQHGGVTLGFAPTDGYGGVNYWQYKFIGIDRPDGTREYSSWVLPFWGSLITWILCKLPLPFKQWARIRRPLGKIATGALAASTIGAIFLPGSPASANLSNTPSTSNASFARPSSNISLNVPVHN